MLERNEQRESELALESTIFQLRVLDKLMWAGNAGTDDIEFYARETIQHLEKAVRLWKQEHGLRVDP